MNASGKGGFGDHPEHINRNGAPKKEDSYTQALREKLEPEELAEKLKWHIEQGSLAALKYAIDRFDGKPRETLETIIETPRVIGYYPTQSTDTEDSETDTESEEV